MRRPGARAQARAIIRGRSADNWRLAVQWRSDTEGRWPQAGRAERGRWRSAATLDVSRHDTGRMMLAHSAERGMAMPSAPPSDNQGSQTPHPHRHRRPVGCRSGPRRQHPGSRRRSLGACVHPPRLPLAASRLRRWCLCRPQARGGSGADRSVDPGDCPAPAGTRGFDILPRRWVVERTLAWLNRNRRLAKDFEATVATAQAWLFIASVQLLTRRLVRY